MKRIWIIVSIPIALVILCTIGLWVYLSFFIDNNFMVKQLESNINARAELKKVQVGLFSLMPSLSCENLALNQRDPFANEGKPMNERPALKSPLISASRIDFTANLLPLLSKRFELQNFVVSEPRINMTLYDNGENNISPLFKIPAIVNGRANPVLDKKRKAASEIKTAPPKTDKAAFSVHDLPLSAQVNRMGLAQGRIDILVQKTKQRFQMSDLDLIIGNIDIDPKDLANHNRAALQFDTNVSISGQDNQEHAKLMLTSSAAIEPFDPKTGLINPGIVYTLRLRQGSFISSLIALDQYQKSLSELSRIGLNLETLTRKAELSKNTETAIAYKNGRVAFVQDLSFPTQHYDFNLRKDSWVNIIDNSHKFDGQLLLSIEASAKALADVDQFIEKQAASAAKRKVVIDTKKVRDQLLQGLVKDERIVLGFSSTGHIRRPVVQLSATPPSLDSVLKEVVKDSVKGMIMEKLDDPKISDDFSPEQKDAAKKMLKGLF